MVNVIVKGVQTPEEQRGGTAERVLEGRASERKDSTEASGSRRRPGKVTWEGKDAVMQEPVNTTEQQIMTYFMPY